MHQLQKGMKYKPVKEKGKREKDERRDGVRVEDKDEWAQAVGHGHFAHYHIANLNQHHNHHAQERQWNSTHQSHFPLSIS